MLEAKKNFLFEKIFIRYNRGLLSPITLTVIRQTSKVASKAEYCRVFSAG